MLLSSMSLRYVSARMLGFVIVFVSAAASAGEIALKNGDLITGELVEIRVDKVIWQSSLFGPLTVPKDQVIRIETKTALKVRGETKPCFWRGLMASDAFFECSNKERRSIPFLAIQQVTEYELFEEISRDYSGKAFVSGSKSTGNKIEESWLADLDMTLRYTDYRHDFALLYDIKSIEQSPELEHYEGRYDFNWFFAPQTYWLWNLLQERDDARNINLRTSGGTGIGYQFWDSKRTALSLDVGALKVRESIRVVDEITGQQSADLNNYGSLRLSSKFRYLLPLNVAFSTRNVFNQSMDISDDWMVNTDTGFSLPFGFGISADIKFLYEYQNLPPGENRKEDATLRFGVGYTW